MPSRADVEGALTSLLIRIGEAREKHPRGPRGMLTLSEELGEVASAIRRESHERVRAELLDLAAATMRLYLGEGRFE